MTDVGSLYAKLECMRYSAYFGIKNKYVCFWDKKNSVIYVKQNTSRNVFSPHARIFCDANTLNVICQYSEAAYIVTYILAVIMLLMEFSFILGEGCIWYKTVGVALIFTSIYSFVFLANKFFFLNECDDIEKDISKIIKSDKISAVYKWKWYVASNI